MEDAAFEGLRDQAEAMGREAGDAVGSWVIDGNTTTETIRSLLRGIEDGDPEVLDALPSSPLSGEWADAPTPGDVLESLHVEEEILEEQDDLLSAYEQGFNDAVLGRVEADARALIEED